MIRHVDVDLVSPAMLGGAFGGLDKPPTLRPPSIRGQLRFWARALSGDDDPRELESELFGSTEIGQRIAVLPTLGSAEVDDRALFPAKTGRARSAMRMIQPGAVFRLRFEVPEARLLDRFKTVLWTWLHLGTLSRRGRRGYGSLLWRPAAADALAGFPLFERNEVLASREDLESYLRRGLAVVRRTLGVPVERAARTTRGWYRLGTLDQIFVGDRIQATYSGLEGGMEDLLHGLGGRAPGGQGEEMGQPKPRLASPMLWRVFPAAGGGYYPVMTWSPRTVTQLEEDSPMHVYLRDTLGVSRSLAGALPLA